jgi:hypothetical protein
MDFLKAVNIIGRDLEEALTLLEQLSDISGSDRVEIELARSRVRSAADLVRLLPTLTNVNEKKIQPAPHVAMEPEKAEHGKTSPAETNFPGAEAREIIRAEPEAVRPEPVQAEVTRTWLPADEPDREEHAEMVIETNDMTEKAPETPPATTQKSQEQSKSILADRFTTCGTLGEKIQTEKKEEVISTVLHSKPITDIASAIGINDRFYFIRELFSGDALAYGDTIKRLNAALSLGEAMRILDESTVMGSDPAAQSSFVDVVRRKFSLHV